ncbi:MAG: tetratricopeptide repeat protein [Fidelibacterota bacterium]|nr:MAG: tetratricopeptide repeat protein [Candidatus Neomarinimicrobiota bacterium]
MKTVKQLLTTISLVSTLFWLAAGSILLQTCVPPPPVEEEQPLSEEELKRRERECLIALSNAWEYYKNREFESSVRNYMKLVDLGCGEENAQDVYIYFGRAYIELGNIDSAVWAFKQGLRYLPEDKALLEIIAYANGRIGNITEQIYYLQRYTEVDPTNAEIFASLTDLLAAEERYDDLILTLQQWLEVEPNNPRVQTDLIAAYEMAGKDPLTFMRQRWEDNPTNAQWGIDYAEKLVENADFVMAYRVLESVIQRTPTARGAYELLANAALDEGDVDRAISALERLFALDRTDERPALELSRAYLRQGEYPRAMEWAETALQISTNGGEALYVRAEVYYTTAEDCASQHESGAPNFQDKLVFLLAYDDYKAAVEKGYRRARTRADFLEKNLIPSKGDWFLQPADLRVFKPQGDCYSWITRTVRRP